MEKLREQMEEVASKYRGDIINELSYLENRVETYIATHFIGNDDAKHFDFVVSLFSSDRMSFGVKVQVFEYLCNKHDKPFLNKYRSFRIIDSDSKKQIKEENIKRHSLISDIQYCLSNRNILAHHIIDDSKEARLAPMEEVTFIKYKDSIIRNKFNPAIISTLLFVIRDATQYISQRLENWEAMRPS